MLRFAQSPTSDMDISNLRVALLNHIISKQQNIELFIRIDDTNKNLNIEEKDKEILEILNLFGIDYTRVIHQSENIKLHTQMAMKLLLDKKAFNCFCSDEALKIDKQKAKENSEPYSYSGFCQTISDETKFNCNAPFIVRLNKPKSAIKFTDKLKGNCSFEPYEIDSFPILNVDKSPTENFACGVDDMIYDISTIVKEDSHINNTAKQILLRESLGYEKEINYIHLPMIIDSKNDDTLCVKNLIDQGYLPVAIANYLIFLSYPMPKEIFTIEEVIPLIDVNKLFKELLHFDIKKLQFFNKYYIKQLDDLRLSKILGYADIDLGKLAKLYLDECNTTMEIKNKLDSIFSIKSTCKDFEKEFLIINNCLKNSPFIEEFQNLKSYIIDKTSLQEEQILTPLRYTLTGMTDGPDLSEIYPLIKNYLGEIIK
ncbi:MAG: glutamate--tRNA ligase [Campylobacterota bacterium]|nr:glutamate--tRNA ligase [Campylobacterota bacterium]